MVASLKPKYHHLHCVVISQTIMKCSSLIKQICTVIAQFIKNVMLTKQNYNVS